MSARANEARIKRSSKDNLREDMTNNTHFCILRYETDKWEALSEKVNYLSVPGNHIVAQPGILEMIL